ncbi:MAG: HAD hydrolase-like protein, partial [Bacillus sp. (in: Bacteria)]|nr:HAD hydrolase-like protein [Bacillus sp. (in: firmicutes)]
MIVIIIGKFPIIFDLDGTLFNCKELSNETFPRTLQALADRHPTGIEIQYYPKYDQFLGMVTDDIFTKLLPNATKELIEEAKQLLIETEFELIPIYGELYQGVEEILVSLSENGFPLYIASNGSKEYVHKVVEVFSLGKYFSGIYSAGEQETKSKIDLVRLLLTANLFKNSGVMVGDRHSDIEAGRLNQLTTVGCLYGFGDAEEIKLADEKIQHLQDLI